MTAVIELGFDPLLQTGTLALRWQTIGVTVALLVALAVAVRDALRGGLRLDDMLLILVGIVPGAVVGGRVVHVLAYADAYLARPLAAIDPFVGGLSLLGAVLGGMVGGLYVASRLRTPVRPWAETAAVPMLLAIGLGKLAQLLGGSGQGVPSELPWAVAFAGPGPWISANPEIASHPSQLYEGLWLLIGAAVLAIVAVRPTRAKALASVGGLFVGALAWLFAGRVLVGFTWRDPSVIGPLNSEQLLALTALAGTLLLLRRGIVEPTTSVSTAAAREPRR